jgi:hypothetical protein
MTNEDIARIIYDIVFAPGTEGSWEEEMPPFDEAKAAGIGGYGAVMKAAEEVRKALGQAAPDSNSAKSQS